MYSDLLPMVRTRDDVDRLCGVLERLEESMFMLNSGGFEEVLKNKVAFSVAEILKNQLPQESEFRQDALRKLKEELLALPIVNLTLAIEISSEEIEEISESLRRNVNAGIILDIQRDSLIVGGALITYQGRFGDFSLATKMENVWRETGVNLIKIAYGNN